jgi:hypothetical protein
MRSVRGRIEIDALRLRCVIGCSHEERRSRSDGVIDLWFAVDAAPARVSDKKVTRGTTLPTREETPRFFTGLDVIDPGPVQVLRWRPDEPEPPGVGKVWVLDVGRKPGPATAVSA